MKKLSVYILSFLCGLCMMFGFAFSLNTTVASAEAVAGTTPTLSTTKYKISKSKEHMLLATGIKDYDDVYEVGYAFKDMDGIIKYHAVTTKYYTSITSGNSTWTVNDMFGAEYTGMIVWEVAYNQSNTYTYQAYAKVGDRIDDNLVTSDTIVYGNRKDLSATNCVITFDLNGGLVNGKAAVADKTVTYGSAFGELPAPTKQYVNFIGWNTKADGTGETITAETISDLKGDIVLYAIYSKGLDFTTADQINAFSKPQTVSYSIVDNYLKISGRSGETNILVFNSALKANSVVEIDVEYVSNNTAYAGGNQATFLAYTANAAGDADGKTTAVIGNAPWDGGWDCKKTTVSVAVTQDCAGIRMQFVYGADASAYFKITGVRVLEYPLIYDFSDESQLNVIQPQKNTTYSIVDNALKVVGTYGSESTLLFKSALKTGAKVEIDVEYVCSNPAYSAGQVTFLAYTANAQGSNDGVTTSVMGNASWDGGWNCKKTTVLTEIKQDCAGLRLQFVMNNQANAYFKISGIRVFYPSYPTYTITYDTTFATQEVTYGSAYGTLASAPKKAGYEFKGWSLNADGSGELVTASTIVKTTKDHALYAVYEKEQSVVEERLEYDFTTSDQAAEFSSISNGKVEIVNGADNYLKLSPVNKTINGVNDPQAEFLFSRSFEAGETVEIDFQLVGAINVSHGVWTYGVNANKDNVFESVYFTAWDAPNAWNNGNFTASISVPKACAGIKFLVRFANNADAYWRINAVRIVEPIEYPVAYDFNDESLLNKFVELDHGGKEIVKDASGSYAKFYPTDMGNLYSIFFFKQNLKAGMTVEMDFELVGSIAVKHGIWTWGAQANGGAQFDGQFVTGWDAPAVWNGGKFTSTTNITADCYGIRIQMRYADNADAYWKLTSIRIIDGDKPTSTVTYSANGSQSTASVTFGGKYSLPSAPAKENAIFKGWYFNAEGTGMQVTANTVVTETSDHTVYAVYKEYYKAPNFFEEDQLWNITNVENTNIKHVKDASGNYLKLTPASVGDTTNANYPQSYFFFEYPSLTKGMIVTMDFELVGAINVGHGIWTWGANANKDNLFDGKFITAWDAPNTWNNGKFTAVTEIVEACAGIRVLVRYANNANAYWKLTGVRVYTAEEYLDVPTYADDKHIDIGATSWLGTNQTLNYFNGANGETNFAKLQEAGITVLAGTFYGNTGSEDDEKRLLDLAAKYGVGLFFQKSWDGSTIPSYVAHEAFLGYYIDEPKQSELSSLKNLKEKWDASAFGANGKQLYVNLLPVYSGDMGGDYDAYVKGAIENSNLPIVSFDHYMMYYKAKKNIFNSITGYESTISLRTDWLKNFDIASYYANKNDKPFWYTLLTTQHLADGDETKYIDPTAADLKYQMYVAMTYGATNLMHYTFAGTGEYIIDGAMFNQNTGEWTQTYTDVKAASAAIGKWDHVFMNFDWLGASTVTGSAAQTGLITNDLTHSVAVNQFGVMSSVTSTQDVVVGHFEDANGYDGVMITNLTIPANATTANVTVTFNGDYKAVKVYQNGEEKLVYLNNGVLSLDIASAEGVFIIPVKTK